MIHDPLPLTPFDPLKSDPVPIRLIIKQSHPSGSPTWDADEVVDSLGRDIAMDNLESDLKLLDHEIEECEQLIQLEDGCCKHGLVSL